MPPRRPRAAGAVTGDTGRTGGDGGPEAACGCTGARHRPASWVFVEGSGRFAMGTNGAAHGDDGRASAGGGGQ